MTPATVSSLPVRARLRHWFSQHSAYARFTLLAAVAGTVAYLLGTILPPVAAITAAITAVISVRPSFDEGLREAVVQVVSTAAGALVATLLVLVFGVSPEVLGVAIVLAFALGRVARLEPERAATIAVTVIIVIGADAPGGTVWSRLWGVLVGSLVAMLASLYVSPGRPVGRTLDTALALGHRLADHLAVVGDALRGHVAGTPVHEEHVRGWLTASEDIRRELEPVRTDAEALVRTAAWSPFTRRAEAQAVLLQVLLTEIVAETASSMCRDLLITQPATVPDRVLEPVADMFAAAGRMLTEQMAIAETDPATRLLAADTDPLADLEDAQARTLEQARTLDETGPLLLGGSLTQDTHKIRALIVDDTDEHTAT